jgi:hypothetical protein
MVSFRPSREAVQTEIIGLWGPGAEKANHRHRLLRVTIGGARNCGAAEQSNQIASPHSMTSSARPHSGSDIISHNVLAA